MGCVTEWLSYSEKGDLLSTWNRVPIKGGARLVTARPDFVYFCSEDGNCVGFDLFDAARILVPYLTQDAQAVEIEYRELRGSYDKESDILVIGNGATPENSSEMAQGVTAHYDEEGKAVGFTLEKAAERLLPHLETWQEPTPEQLAAIAHLFSPPTLPPQDAPGC